MIFPWSLAGMIATPLLAAGIAYVWVDDFLIIRDLRQDVTRVEKERDTLKDEIHDPVNGWVIRFQASELNNVTLRGSINEQNKKLDELAAAQIERERILEAKLAKANADVVRFDKMIVDGLNRRPQGSPPDIARQALQIVFDSVDALP